MDMEETWSHVLHNWVFACQILKIVGSQIEIERIFSLARVFTNLKRCHLQLENVEKFFLWTKIGPMNVKLVLNPFLTFYNLLE